MHQSIFNRPFWRFFEKLADVFLLNTLWLVGCIPIVTIGASTTALYYVSLKLAGGQKVPIFAAFKKSFRENLRQSTFLWLLYVFAAVDCYLIGTALSRSAALSPALPYLGGLVLFFYFLTLLYLFPVIAVFQASTLQCFINAVALSLRHLVFSVLMLLIAALALAAVYFLPPLFLLAFAGISRIHSIFFLKIFGRYIAPDAALGREREPCASADEE